MKIPDYTFWTRLLFHLEGVKANCAIGEEELEYLKYVAKQQLKQQYNLATGEELEYLNRLKTLDKL